MSRTAKYDYAAVAAARAQDPPVPWAELAELMGAPSADRLQSGFIKWRKRQCSTDGVRGDAQPTADGETERGGDSGDTSVEHTFTADELSRITSLEDLLAFFKVDTEAWEVRDYRVNKWEQAAKGPDKQIVVTPLYQVRANLIRKIERDVEAARRIMDELLEDARTHAPAYMPVVRPAEFGEGNPVLYVVAVKDPHIGMLAWGKEVGRPYDSNIAVRDYADANRHLLSVGRLYNAERILIVAGNDFLHVDTLAPGGKGAMTTGGTQQEIDSRLAKMFTTGRRALVAAIDEARLVAPVDVLFVPGNHDRETTYRMGEVIAAWYRNDPEVNVLYGPNRRHFYGYGRNAFMLTHGEEYKRQRDNLPLIFATECPAEIWLASENGCREVLTGHNHINMQGRYTPTSEVNETRAIRTRALPGLTPEDSWHYGEGYKHRRAATAIAYYRTGGVAGLHEFTL